MPRSHSAQEPDAQPVRFSDVNWKKVRYYYRPHLFLFITDMLCCLGVSLCDLIYPMIARLIINDYVYRSTTRYILAGGAWLLALYLGKALMNWYIQYKGHVMGVRIQADMRRDLFKHLEKLPFSYYDNNKTGTIMSRLVNDLFEISELAHHGPENLIISTLMLIGAFIVLVRINLYLTLIVFAVIPFMVFFAIKLRRKLDDAFMKSRIQIGEVNAELETSLSGIRVTRSYTSEAHELGKFDQSNTRFVKARMLALKMMAHFHSVNTLLSDIMYLVGLISCGLFLFYKKIDVGDFTAFLLYIHSFIKPIGNLVNIFEQLQDGFTGIRRFNEIMNVPEEQDDPGARPVSHLSGDIRFNDVSFTYHAEKPSETARPVISHMSLHIEPGRTVALVGPSGGGKTTLCNLIPRFYEIDSGSITIDGMDIRSMTRESLRRNIGMVAQDVFLFNGTVRENIAYGKFDATDEEIIDAAKKADIHDYILSMPQGYDTNVGERGIKLSGGQKQRISIARVFLKDPSILILDEATSSLDNATEMQIQSALQDLTRGRTCLIVAHRLSTIKNADEIIVITDEGIKERGTHEQLLKENGLYAQLYSYQFKA